MGGRLGRVPILIDLDGDGLKITRLDDSHLFFDIGGDGYKHRAAWAGAGDGVLVIDADGDGKISGRREVVLTDWDPSAGTDMEALRQVFDTNHDGVLDAGDAQWQQFKVAVTQGDGTVVLKSLDELGIRSLTLTADETHREFEDGSSIDGEAIFTRTDGSTGKTATATLAIDAQGYAVTETVATDAVGATTVSVRALGGDGSLASETTRTTSADGKTVVTRFDNDGDGVVDRVLTQVAETLADGRQRLTETAQSGAGVLIGSTVTTTSADGRVIEIDRDQLGGGFVTETERRETLADNSLVVTITEKSADGSVIRSERTVLSADRLAESTATDEDGDGVFERVSASATTRHADGTLTLRDSVTAASGALLSLTVTEVSADGLGRVETIDSDGDGLADRSTVSATARDTTTGATRISEAVKARDGSLIGTTTTTVTSDGLSKVVASDENGDGVTDTTTAEVTTISADKTRTQTITRTSANGTLLSRTVTARASDGLTGSKTVDSDGNGAADQTVTVVKDAAGQTVETTRTFSADRRLLSSTVATTSSDGLSIREETDRYGRGIVDETLLDVTVRQGDGSARQTVEQHSADGSLIRRTATVTSADGLNVRESEDLDGDGVFERVSDERTTVATDGSQQTAVEIRSADGILLSREATSLSADRRRTEKATDEDGDGKVETVNVVTIGADGSRVEETKTTTDLGALTSRTLATTSANGLAVDVAKDVDGDGAVDTRTTTRTVLSTDGGRTTTQELRAGDGRLVRRNVTEQSGNAMNSVESTDENGDGISDATTRVRTTLNADGSTTKATTTFAGATLVSSSITTTSASGRSTSQTIDSDGDGDVDRKVIGTTELQASGAVVATTSTRSGNGALLSTQTITTSANGRSVRTETDRNGDGHVDLVTLHVINSDGSVIDKTMELSVTGATASSMDKLVSRDGLVSTTRSDRDGDGTLDARKVATTSLKVDGSIETTTALYSGTNNLLETETRRTSANGLQETTIWTDVYGRTTRSVERSTVKGIDGSSTTEETCRKANDLLESSRTSFKSGDGNTASVVEDRDGDGVADERVSSTIGDDGVRTEVFRELAADGVTVSAMKTMTTSANGALVITAYDADGDGIAETREVETVTHNADGSSTTRLTREEWVAGAWQQREWEEETISGDGLATSRRSGDASYTKITSLLPDGSQKTVEHFGTSGAGAVSAKTRSANGMSVGRTLDIEGDGIVDQRKSEVTVANDDGSRTETISNVTADGTLLSSAVTAVSADGHVTTVTETSNVAGWTPRTTKSETRDLADGGSIVTVTARDADGKLLNTVSTTETADGRSVTIERDADGDGAVDQREVRTQFGDGRLSVVTTRVLPNGSLLGKTTTTVSADGRSTESETDKNGDGIIDLRRLTERTEFADGAVETVTSVRDRSAKLTSKSTERWSADASVHREFTDVDGDGVIDHTVEERTLLSGATTAVVKNNAAARKASEIRSGEIYWGNAIAAEIVTSRNADGLSSTTTMDMDGDGRFDVTMNTVTQIDGSLVTAIRETNADGSVKASGSLRESHDGLVTVLVRDDGNDGSVDYTETVVERVDGSAMRTVVERDGAGNLLRTTHEEIGGGGELRLREVSDGAGRIILRRQLNPDGTTTETSYDAASGSTLSVSRFNADGLLTSASLFDPLGQQTWNRVEQTYSRNVLSTDVTYLDDGSQTQRWMNANGLPTIQKTLDAAGHITAEFTFSSSILSSATYYDVESKESWSRVEQSFTTAGVKQTERSIYDDGSSSLTTFDTTTGRRIGYRESDASGVIRYAAGYGFAGGSLSNEAFYDTANKESWSEISRGYNASGVLTSDFVRNDDGSSRYASWDANGKLSSTSETDTLGQTVFSASYTNGVLARTKAFDRAGTQSWRQVDKTYGPTGAVTSETDYWDDGSSRYTSWDANGKLSFTNETDTLGHTVFSASYTSGVLARTTVYDRAGTQSWSQVGKTYDTTGAVTSEMDYWDDGIRTMTSWDRANSQTWAMTVDRYNQSGQLTDNAITYDDGTRQLTSLDPANSQTWSKIVELRSASDALTRQTITYDNGTTSVWVPPVVLDLDGNDHIDLRPFDAFAADQSGPAFDWDDDGIRDATAWVGASDGFLAIDLAADGGAGSDGVIDQARELAFANWVEDDGMVSDMEGLRLAFDTNHDNVLDMNDERWNEFRVWQDHNQNGVSDAGELLTMSEAGIRLVNLLPSTEGARAFADGSMITGTSSMGMTDGSTRLVADTTLSFRPSGLDSQAA